MRSRLISHPLLFGVYPVLFAYEHNVDFAPPFAEIALLVVSFAAAAAALWAVLAWLTGNTSKSALFVTLFIAMFFSYGHVANLVGSPLANFHVLSMSFGANRAPAFVWVVGGLLFVWWLNTWSATTVWRATTLLNRVGIALMVLTVVSLATSVYVSARSVAVHRAPAPQVDSTSVVLTGPPPDIYYIILDGYARADVLRDLYSYDNAPFLEWLRQKGFYVAEQSHSNYSQTMLSLASSLNLGYLEAPKLQSALEGRPWPVALNVAAKRYFEAGRAFCCEFDGIGLTSTRLPLAHMIQHSDAVRVLKNHGYRHVAFTSGYGGVQLPNADVVMRAEALDDFEEVLIDATPIPRVLERLYDPVDLHRDRVRYVFDHLADEFGSNGSPTFVFAHVLCPHVPFAFRANGTEVPASEVVMDDRLSAHGEQFRGAIVSAYRDQIQFVNQQMETVISTILARARRPPIIILQSDHGSEMTVDQSNPSAAGLRERMSILNAYYVPADVRAELYPGISPVNSLRTVFRHYFSTAWLPLPDESYFSSWASPYDFVSVDKFLNGQVNR